MAITEGELLWQPGKTFSDNSNVSKYIAWLRERGIADCEDYRALWHWSVTATEAFWASIWEYFGIISETPYEKVATSLEMKPGVRWFTGSRVNFAEHVMRRLKPGKTAIHHLSEIQPLTRMDGAELAQQVRILATALRAMGIKRGDAVGSLMPNIPQTVVAMLAAISIGAVWSNAAPEFGKQIVLDRFGQIKPKLLFVADGYPFGGKRFKRSEEIKAIVAALGDSLEQVVYLPYIEPDNTTLPVPAKLWQDLLDGEDPGADAFRFERVAHDHPLWVLFSSGTTGLPKAIVHSHVGALVEMEKCFAFHLNITSASVAFFYTTTGWVMFNSMIGMLLAGAAIVLYDGNPAYPGPDVLWKMAADTGATMFGASPTYVQMMQKNGIVPGKQFDLNRLDSILVGGAPSTPETFEWFYTAVKRDLWVTSQSGGTEIVSGFVGATPTQPVYAGEIQTRMLGMAVESWADDRTPLIDEVGELVCTRPFPSMPIYFLNDPDGRRYREAYFDDIPGVWRHGDFLKINRHGGCYIYGRSDSTLNRHGVRIGTAEIYRVVDSMEQVADSLAVCIELPGGNFFMPLFVQLALGQALDDALIARINAELREKGSPRHVPDKIIVVPKVPYTLTGKKMEVPARKLLMGWPLEKACSRDIMRDPTAIDFFVDYAGSTSDYPRSAW